MTTLSDKQPRIGVKTASGSDPVYNSGRVGDRHTNTSTGEIFTKVDADLWRGTQGGLVLGITSPLNPDLILMYTMDSSDISGSTLLDSTPNNNDGTLINSPANAVGLIGDSLNMVGTSGNFVDVSPTALLPLNGDFTITGWVYFDSLDANADMIFSQYLNSITGRFMLYRAGGPNRFTVFHNGTLTTDPTVPTTGVWYFITCYRSGNEFGMSVDNGSFATIDTGGVALLNTGNIIGMLTDSGSTYNSTAIESGGPQYSTARHDQLRVFNRVLTTEEITQLYNGGAGA